MTYKLICTETGRKSGKYHYQVVDENGNVISERHSDREYAACTVSGHMYFGRLDLIGKGDHGSARKFYKEIISGAKVSKWCTKEDAQKHLDALNAIAYRQ